MGEYNKEMKCLYCGNSEFLKEKSLLNKRFGLFDPAFFMLFKRNTIKGTGTAYICDKCGFIQEFKDLEK